MKKLFLSLLLMFLPILASSQTLIKTIKDEYLLQIPKDLCLLNHMYFKRSERQVFDFFKDQSPVPSILEPKSAGSKPRKSITSRK